MDLLKKIEEEFEILEVMSGTKEKIMPYVLELAEHHEPTFEHSVRVAYIGKKIAESTHITEPKSLWLPGLVHDLGKDHIPLELLDKKVGWTNEDSELMKAHVREGCLLLVDGMKFCALTTFYSHFFQRDGSYPEESDFKGIFGNVFDNWSEASKAKGKYCGRLVALADVYDSITTRENDKFSPGNPRLPSPGEAKSILLSKNTDQEFLINYLYNANIF